jgi:hypothetical protein
MGKKKKERERERGSIMTRTRLCSHALIEFLDQLSKAKIRFSPFSSQKKKEKEKKNFANTNLEKRRRKRRKGRRRRSYLHVSNLEPGKFCSLQYTHIP